MVSKVKQELKKLGIDLDRDKAYGPRAKDSLVIEGQN